ncbi:MAG: hypothetical protein H0Z33_15290 [Bacillaceae bacterium]|nr:hypothetical protein [Bacillaceae bacterium]
MYEKTCPRCGKKSYRSSDRGVWLCPYPISKTVSSKNHRTLKLYTRCRCDLTFIPARIAR